MEFFGKTFLSINRSGCFYYNYDSLRFLVESKINYFTFLDQAQEYVEGRSLRGL